MEVKNQSKIGKQCEECGQYSNNWFYRFIGEVRYTIYLNSPLIISTDKINEIVHFINGNTLKYNIILGNQACAVTDFTPHIFCTENCEDYFLEEYSSYASNEVINNPGVIFWEHNELFSPVSIPIEYLKYENTICNQCGINFPNLYRTFAVFPILGSRIDSGNFDNPPSDPKYLAFSDMGKEKQYGNWYSMMINLKKIIHHHFCSNECAFEFAVSTNSAITFKSNFLTGMLVNINPYSVQINQGLKNPYLYRPQKLGYMKKNN